MIGFGLYSPAEAPGPGVGPPMQRRWLPWAAVFLLALSVRLAVVGFLSRPPVNDQIWNDAVGWNLASGHGFTASPKPPYVLGVFRTPGYPAFLATIYALTGHSYRAVYTAQAALDASTGVLIGLIALRLAGRRVALTTATLYALYPYPAVFCGTINQDVLLTFSVVVALALTVEATLRAHSPARWLWVGVAVGLAALVKAVMILFGALPALVLVTSPRRPRDKMAALLALALGASGVVTPWVIRNYLVFGSFPPLAVGGTGDDLMLLVDEIKEGEEVATLRRMATPPVWEARSYLESFVDGEALILQERELARRASPELGRRWRAYLWLMVRHVPRLWLTRHAVFHGETAALAAKTLSWCLLLPGLAGMVLLIPRWRQLLPLYGTVAIVTLMYVWHPVEARYTLPARPAMCFFIAAALGMAWERLRRKGMADTHGSAMPMLPGREWLPWAVVFLLALSVRLAVVGFLSRPPANDQIWNDAAGWNLASGHGFTASPKPPYVPGVFRTPGYPAFLATIYALTGHSYRAVYTAQALLDALSTVLIGLVSLRLAGRRLALTTATLYALYPYPAVFCGTINQDILLTFSVVVALALTVEAARAAHSPSRWLWVGMAVGLAALVKAIMILFGALPALVAVASPRRPREKMIGLLALALGASGAVAPWVIRNYLAFGSFPPLAVGGTGTNLVYLLEELEQGESAMVQRRMATPPKTDAKSYLESFTDGEVLIHRERELARQASPELARRWRAYLWVMVRHVSRLWLTRHAISYEETVARGARVLSWYLLLPGIAGMVLLMPRWKQLLPLYGTVALVTLIYVPYTAEARYTLPARPAMCFFAAATLCMGWQRLRRASAPLGHKPSSLILSPPNTEATCSKV